MPSMGCGTIEVALVLFRVLLFVQVGGKHMMGGWKVDREGDRITDNGRRGRNSEGNDSE